MLLVFVAFLSCVRLSIVGLEKTSHEAGGLQLRLQGLGGSKNIRGYWQHYFAQSHAFVFVVDGSDAARLVSRLSELCGVGNYCFNAFACAWPCMVCVE